MYKDHVEKNKQWLDSVRDTKFGRMTEHIRLGQEEAIRRKQLSGSNCRFCSTKLTYADHEDGFCMTCSSTVNY